MKPDAKTARIEARVSDRQKTLFQHAADLAGRSLTDFVISSVQEVATRTIREHEVLTLSGRDRQVFIDALLKPPAPSRRRRQAARRYRRTTAHSVARASRTAWVVEHLRSVHDRASFS